jgi:hypothetical protein
LIDITHDFLVIIEKTAEPQLWDFLDGQFVLNIARITIPDNADGNKPGRALIRRIIAVSINGVTLDLKVTGVLSPETTNSKFEELRKTDRVV